MFSCAVGRERHCRQISLACVGSARSAWPTLGLPCSRCVWFPGLHCSGSRVLCRGAVQSGCGVFCPSQVRAAQAAGSLASALSPVGPESYSPSGSQPLGSPGALRERRLRCAVYLLWGASLRLRPCVLPSGSQPLGFPGALWERRPRCAVCLLWGAGLRLRPCVLLTFQVPAPRFPGCTAGAPFQVCCVSPLGSWPQAVTLRLTHLPGPSPLVPWVRCGSAVSDVPCVSSGELVSGCDPPGGCQPSRSPGRLGWQLGACSQFGGGRWSLRIRLE